MDCVICANTYTKRNHPIKCQYCDFSACVTCCKTYLLSISKPKCMSNDCLGEWSRKHMRDNFTQVFINNEFREHQKNLLLAQQMALMPETQLIIEEKNRVYKINIEISELNEHLYELRKSFKEDEEQMMGDHKRRKEAHELLVSWHTTYYGNLYIKQLNDAKETLAQQPDPVGLLPIMQMVINGHSQLADAVKNSIDNLDKAHNTIYTAWNARIRKYSDDKRVTTEAVENLYTQLGRKPKTKTEFIRKCGNADCRGFLNTRWNCGICEQQTCIDCHEIVADGHACNPDTVATVKLLKNDTKGCPKCQTNIFKIDGCDQMWCTQCKTAFSWTTGKIETKIHNPHYYEWRRQNGGLERERGDNPCIAPHDVITSLELSLDLDDEARDVWIEKCRRCIHMSAYNRNPEPPDFEQDRIQYLENEIDAEVLKTKLIRGSKSFQKKQELFTVYELFTTTFMDIMIRYCFRSDLVTLDEVGKIIEYVNTCFAEIAYSYGSINRHMIDTDLSVIRVKS